MNIDYPIGIYLKTKSRVILRAQTPQKAMLRMNLKSNFSLLDLTLAAFTTSLNDLRHL